MVMVRKNKQWIRTAVQIFFFVWIGTIALRESGWIATFLPEASIHALCPFGGVVSIYKFATTGTFVQKIHESSFILMWIVFLLAVLLGPVLCGWVCPLGTFQEWLGKLGRKLFGKRYNHFIPSRLDQYLRYLRYVSLFLVVYLTATSARLIFQDYDPYYAMYNFWSDETAVSALLILGLTILLSLFVERPWCKYACPYGAVLGITNLFRVFKIRRTAASCVSCKTCDRVCPMNIRVSEGSEVLSHQCISCMRCTSENACPIANTVHFSTKGGRQG